MKRFAVIGLGRFGKKLAIALAMSGAEVVALDKNRDEIELIRDQVSLAVRLDHWYRTGHRTWFRIGNFDGSESQADGSKTNIRKSGRFDCRRGFLQGWRYRCNLS